MLVILSHFCHLRSSLETGSSLSTDQYRYRRPSIVGLLRATGPLPTSVPTVGPEGPVREISPHLSLKHPQGAEAVPTPPLQTRVAPPASQLSAVPLSGPGLVVPRGLVCRCGSPDDQGCGPREKLLVALRFCAVLGRGCGGGWCEGLVSLCFCETFSGQRSRDCGVGEAPWMAQQVGVREQDPAAGPERVSCGDCGCAARGGDWKWAEVPAPGRGQALCSPAKCTWPQGQGGEQGLQRSPSGASAR